MWACWQGGCFAVNHVLLENSTLTTSDVLFAVVVPDRAQRGSDAGARRRGQAAWILVAALTIGLAPLVRVNGWGVPPAAAIYLLLAAGVGRGVGIAVLPCRDIPGGELAPGRCVGLLAFGAARVPQRGHAISARYPVGHCTSNCRWLPTPC